MQVMIEIEVDCVPLEKFNYFFSLQNDSELIPIGQIKEDQLPSGKRIIEELDGASIVEAVIYLQFLKEESIIKDFDLLVRKF